METPTPKQERLLALFFDRIYEIGAVLEQEQKKYDVLIENQVALRGKVLTYHLVTEQLITQELLRLKSNKTQAIKGNIFKMRYSEKLAALPRQLAYSQIRKGFKELNEMRNNMVHDLQFVPDLIHVPNIVSCMGVYFLEQPENKPQTLEAYLHLFLKLSIGIFASRSGNTRTEIDKFLKVFPAAKQLFKRVIH